MCRMHIYMRMRSHDDISMMMIVIIILIMHMYIELTSAQDQCSNWNIYNCTHHQKLTAAVENACRELISSGARRGRNVFAT